MNSPKSILDYETITFNEEEMVLEIIDQTKLPSHTEILKLSTAEDIYDAILKLKVRGAPAIGVTAALGIYLLAIKHQNLNYDDFLAEFKKDSDYLNSSRPTAVNLSWALKRMEKIVTVNSNLAISEILNKLKQEAYTIKEEDTDMCRRIGENGLTLLKKGDGILTHCNAGQLATSKYGTATAPMYLGHECGYDFRIYCDETRPLLQGARLTAYELHSAGLNVTLSCDNMVASLMREGKINAVLVGCDRVAANGDVANKIGTSVVATVAKYYNVPFYVCAPSSTIDPKTKTGKDIKIEMRNPSEVTDCWYENRMAPVGINVYNPAFDITPNELITAIITEKGVIYPPYNFS